MVNGNLLIAKTFTYRISLFIAMTILTYLWFGNFTKSLAFSIVSFMIGTSWYFLHEYLWETRNDH